MRIFGVEARALAFGASLLLLGCTSTGEQTTERTWPRYISGDAAAPGYRHDEATQFIEFCVELDNQDDRLADKEGNNPALRANIDPNLWNPIAVFDSRKKLAEDLVKYSGQPPNAENHWAQLYDVAIKNAKRKYPKGWSAEDVFNDPDLNGYGPWQNAWLLYEGTGKFAGAYAIAIRGTVFSNLPSAAEDAWFHTVSARGVVSKSVRFADSRYAALHSGFAHATFTLLFDEQYGILSVLRSRNIPQNSRLYIVGHSQGAAMTTLVHAFLHYAMRNDDAGPDAVFDLKGKRFRLKSYGFAQPKPANYEFSTDFARITQGTDNAIVINNDIDPVPKVPLTLQGIGDIENNFRGASFAVRTVQFISSFGKVIRQTIAAIAEPFVRESARGYGYFYNYDQIQPLGPSQNASSWNFSPAGRVLLVFGHPADPNDLFLQHHATTYRELIREQLAPQGQTSAGIPSAAP